MNPANVAVPPGVVTSTSPVAPVPKIAVIVLASITVKEVGTSPPKVTTVAPARLVPVIVMVVPLPAVVGVKEVIVGAGIKVNPAREAVPPSVVTETLPLAAVPKIAVMLVDELTINEVGLNPPN